MSKRISERQRWVRLYAFSIRKTNNPEWSAAAYDHAQHIVSAFAKIGRIVRLETESGMLVLKARR